MPHVPGASDAWIREMFDVRRANEEELQAVAIAYCREFCSSFDVGVDGVYPKRRSRCLSSSETHDAAHQNGYCHAMRRCASFGPRIHTGETTTSGPGGHRRTRASDE